MEKFLFVFFSFIPFAFFNNKSAFHHFVQLVKSNNINHRTIHVIISTEERWKKVQHQHPLQMRLTRRVNKAIHNNQTGMLETNKNYVH